MDETEEVLSKLKKGSIIEFRYHPLLLGIGHKDIIAEFVAWNPEKHTMAYRKLYFDPVFATGSEEKVGYHARVSHLHKGLSANTGPR